MGRTSQRRHNECSDGRQDAPVTPDRIRLSRRGQSFGGYPTLITRETGRSTKLLQADAAGIREAARLVREGGLVAFPTETVYGLGADAGNSVAVEGIFRAKGRPAEDPLIVHVAQRAQLEGVVREFPPAAESLAARFWPGPLTLVLPRTNAIPAGVTAGLPTVGVRVPAHPVARALLDSAAGPVAAPSANLFSRPSPTTAQHVLDDLDGRIHAILDGGPTHLGVESTIVDLSGERPRLLRPGGVPSEAIEEVLGVLLLPPPTRSHGPQAAPGLLDVHYAPRTPLTLIYGPPGPARQRLLEEVQRARASGRAVGALLAEEDRGLLPTAVHVALLGHWDDPEASANQLFAALRALDRAGLDVLYARDLAEPARGLGRALHDRLRRAATHRVDARA